MLGAYVDMHKGDSSGREKRYVPCTWQSTCLLRKLGFISQDNRIILSIQDF